MITKRAWEEIFRYRQFRRPDGKGWLAATETITTPTVTIKEKDTGADKTASMISDVSVDAGTKIKYKLKSGDAGKAYLITFRVVSSLGQKYEDQDEVRIS